MGQRLQKKRLTKDKVGLLKTNESSTEMRSQEFIGEQFCALG